MGRVWDGGRGCGGRGIRLVGALPGEDCGNAAHGMVCWLDADARSGKEGDSTVRLHGEEGEQPVVQAGGREGESGASRAGRRARAEGVGEEGGGAVVVGRESGRE